MCLCKRASVGKYIEEWDYEGTEVMGQIIFFYVMRRILVEFVDGG